MPDTPRPLLTLEQVAEILGLSVRTTRSRLVRRQLCAFVRVGREIRVRREVLDQWLAEQEAASMSEVAESGRREDGGFWS